MRFTQKDIREVQLAKAAVRAGIDILLREAGMETADVARLYLAGGFGSAMRPESAARIGLIPEELSDRVTVLGNAAGSGALRYATEEGAAESALGIHRRLRGTDALSRKGMRLERGETFPASGTPARIAFSPRLSPSFSQSARNAMREKNVPYE